jgi:hypothetical protein
MCHRQQGVCRHLHKDFTVSKLLVVDLTYIQVMVQYKVGLDSTVGKALKKQLLGMRSAK